MFNRARLKLTACYLLIIMLISILFSVAIYEVLTQELDRVERVQRLRQDRAAPMAFERRIPRSPAIDPEVIEETKNRLIVILVLLNFGILGISFTAGYFLAGRTLKPIKDMVDEQARFITDSSHELRTPLTSLRTEIEVGLRDKKLTFQPARKLLESNLEEVKGLQYLSDNLIKLTQYQKGGTAKFEEIDLLVSLENAMKKVENIAKNKNITIKNSVKNFIVKGDRQSLMEMFVIFLDNAIKYSPKGRVVKIIAKENNGSVQIEIKDQGFGVDAGEIPHLFDRFYRADKSRTKEDIAGFGLGLSIAKQIIEKHHGSIKVESLIGKGTTFSIQFPKS